MNAPSHSKYLRKEKKIIPDSEKDEKYYERRRRNNEAAKKSRDARRIREDFIELRLKILEGENGILQRRIILLCEEIESLHAFILQIQRQIPEIFKHSLQPHYHSMQTTSSHNLQWCCIKHFDELVSSNPTMIEITSNSAAATVGAMARSTSTSRFSSSLKISTHSTI